MEGFAVVKRYYVDGGDGDKCYLSLLSLRDWSSIDLGENLYLPPYVEDDSIECNSCGPLLYMDDFKGNIVLCNLTTKQLKFIPPPKLDASIDDDDFDGSGLGYDSKSDDYKVIRHYTEKTELYSLKTGVWKTFPRLNAIIQSETGIYVNGSCHWTTILGFSLRGPSYKFSYHILSFDFTTESFNVFQGPPTAEDSDLAFHLVEYHGLLGAIGYNIESSVISTKGFELWVREESSWSKVFEVVLSGVERPLGLKDGRWLFLEGTSCNELCQLLVYDLILKDLKELGIYDYPNQMNVTSYVESQFALPDARPMRRSYTDEEEEEIKKKRETRFVVLSGSGCGSESGCDSESECEPESGSESESESEDESEDDEMEEEGWLKNSV